MFRLFSWVIFPSASDDFKGAISSLKKFSTKYSQLKMHLKYCWCRWQIEPRGPNNIDTGVVEISPKICINHWDTCGKFATLALKLLPMSKTHTAKTKCRKFETNIPSKGISGPQSQFPHSGVCEGIIYSYDGSAFSAGGNMWTDAGNI